MDKVKLSELDRECKIITGKRNELACAEMLLFRIYTGMKYSERNIALLNDKNYEIEIDVKKEDIIEGFKCWVCDKYLGESEDADCSKHSVKVDRNLAPEYVYILKSKNVQIGDKI